jgi:purine-binding chemotaxis protein CheW
MISTPVPKTSIVESLDILSFTLGAEEYGLPIQFVQELRSYETPTRIANAPEHIKGVINLRGIIVPVMDLRIRLVTSTPSYDEFTVTVILNLGGRTIGMVVDGVAEVANLDPAHINPPPLFAAAFAPHVSGIATVEHRMITLLDIEQLIAGDDLLLAA